MNLHVMVLALVTLLVVPQVGGPITCMAHESSAPTDSQTEHASTPSTDCSSENRATSSFDASCSSCAVALMPDSPFLAGEMFSDSYSAVVPLAFFQVPSPHWRPPA